MSKEIFTSSDQIEIYQNKSNRQGLKSFYESERKTLQMILPECKSITDIGCLSDDTAKAIQAKYDIIYTGIDIDTKAIKGLKQNDTRKFYVGDFMDARFKLPKSDCVIAFNLFDHFSDWKKALRNLKRFSHGIINISSLLRLDGATLIDPDTSYIYYGQNDKRLLWAVHNIFELASYCGTEDIRATDVFCYCYHKYNKTNITLSKMVSHPFPVKDMLVGNIIIRFDDTKPMQYSHQRPDLKIVLDHNTIYDSPWKEFC